MFGTSIGVMERMAKRLGLLLVEPNGQKRLSARLELAPKE